ncbi:PepSY-associated TM helix domain-containing protein [Adhaeribacter pallidiroseus]|uniref:Assimilatory sulfite reductase (NADPH) n=1 Tax=Adhaeribacter pallidiroseus TaxID=2072847 RepID=A0A369QDV0_9BACT|nr:PepSY-associated TM helix domain-containing protein [Adhaeribacter pallidiroseus]RDC61735.1 Assimilatory sulfite reductase (NADPH) [Adhaeribacter pallidiroseus]
MLRKVIGKLHLWLGFSSGLIVLFLALTGCILAFQREIENATQTYRYVVYQPNAGMLPPSQLKQIADTQLPGKKSHSVIYQKNKSAQVVYYNFAPEYYYLVYLNPYTGKVMQVKDMSQDFFRIVIMGHYYLWLPPTIGQPILASATLIFVVMLITGIILWWPKNKAARKQRFSIKWNAAWRRRNYDLHSVLGFYITAIILFIALSGLVMGFKWVANSIYWTASGGKQMTEFYESFSQGKASLSANKMPAIDQLWLKMQPDFQQFTGSMEVHIPENRKSSIEIAFNPETDTYWKTDYRYYDQHTLQEIEVKHVYGKIANATAADKLMRMNYDIHVGAIAGLPGKIIAFIASLFAGSLPITGFIIWWGRHKKDRKEKKRKLFATPELINAYRK